MSLPSAAGVQELLGWRVHLASCWSWMPKVGCANAGVTTPAMALPAPLTMEQEELPEIAPLLLPVRTFWVRGF